MLRAACHHTMSSERRVTFRHTSSSFFAHSRSGRWAIQAPFQAPIETPTTKSGVMPRSIRACSMPTWVAPRAPPPEIAKAVLSRRQFHTFTFSVGKHRVGCKCLTWFFASFCARDPSGRLLYFGVTRRSCLQPDDQRVPITQGGGLLDCLISSLLRTHPTRKVEPRRWRSSLTRRKLLASG